MRWNPFIDLRCEVSPTSRAKCKACDVEIERGSFRVKAINVLGQEQLYHLDCAATKAPDLAARKLKDKAPDWPAQALVDLERFVDKDAQPSPRSYQRTPILDLSYDKRDVPADCVFCGLEAPGGKPGVGHENAVRAFSVDGERRLHAACALELAPGLCQRVVLEASERWPEDVRAFFKAHLDPATQATPRSPWRDTGGIPTLEVSPSGRAACRYTKQKIEKGDLRISRQQVFGMRRSPVYFSVEAYVASDDFHPRMLELMVLKSPADVTREQLEALVAKLPPDPPEDDDVTPLGERLLTLFDAKPQAQPEAEVNENLTENKVDIPTGFFFNA
ncbi:MAG: hypothetical protein R3F62_27275 [Planctomycetota bacterium]